MNSFEKIADLITSSSKIAVLTGAGISTESGLPDFRSDNGFWKNNEPIQFSNFIKDERQRRLSWTRNIELHKLLEKIAPNSGHELVKKIISLNKDNILINSWPEFGAILSSNLCNSIFLVQDKRLWLSSFIKLLN